MDSTARRQFVAIVIALCAATVSNAQQPVTEQGAQPQAGQQPAVQPATAQQPNILQPPAAQPPAPLQAPPGFQLNALEQAALDAALAAWQQNNAGIKTFSCSFQRWEYDIVFGAKDQAGKDIPLYKNEGELTYSRPDKGSFQIKATNKWTEAPAPADQPNAPKSGSWQPQADAVGDHWVCDGKSVYQYRPDLKQLVEHPIPPQMQGQSIVDGPLPFLFGADANKLKEKYWLKLDQQQNQDPNQVWIIALPKYQAQAADFTEVDVVLDRQTLLPRYMQVWMPNRSHHTYIFDIKTAAKNNPLAQIQALFSRPSVPFGWKRVVEDLPLQQAAEPKQPPR